MAEFKNGFADITFLVAHFDAVQSADSCLAHLVGYGVVTLAREPVDTGLNREWVPASWAMEDSS